jgi:hypothetical protein
LIDDRREREADLIYFMQGLEGLAFRVLPRSDIRRISGGKFGG